MDGRRGRAKLRIGRILHFANRVFTDSNDEDEATLNVYVDNETGEILQMWVSKEED